MNSGVGSSGESRVVGGTGTGVSGGGQEQAKREEALLLLGVDLSRCTPGTLLAIGSTGVFFIYLIVGLLQVPPPTSPPLSSPDRSFSFSSPLLQTHSTYPSGHYSPYIWQWMPDASVEVESCGIH